MTPIIRALRPDPWVSAAWISVTEPESGPVVYTLHQACRAAGVIEKPLTCAEALRLLARCGVMG